VLPFDDRDRDSVARDLVAEDEEVRRLAVLRVEALPRDDVVPCLVGCLGDSSWRVRKAAVSRLVAWPDQAQTAVLLIRSLHDDGNPGRRNGAVDALIQTGRPAIPHLIEAAEARDADVRKFVVDALAGIGDERAVPTLVARLSDADPNVRGSAADALGAIGGEAPETALREALADVAQPALVRFSALRALDALETPIHSSELAGALSEKLLRPGALALLGRAEDDPDAVEILAKAVASDARSCREAAIRGLLRVLAGADNSDAALLLERLRADAEAHPQAIDSVIERLPDADLATQLVLVQFLGLARQGRAAIPVLQVGTDEALEPVVLASLGAMQEVAVSAIDAAWDELPADSRRIACAFFARAPGEESAARLLHALHDEDGVVRMAAARSVGERDLAAGVERLVDLLEAAAGRAFEGEEERIAVSEALIVLGRASEPARAEEIVRRLAPLLASEEPVRLAAATAMAGLGRPVNDETMRLLLRDASANVRRVAVGALAGLHSEAGIDALHLAVADESPDVRVAAASALGRCGDALFEDLARLAEDADSRVRASAVRAVAARLAGGTDPVEGRAGLAMVERACEDVGPVALAAVEAVGQIGSEAIVLALALLERAESDIVREAVRCLGAHGDDRTLEAVVPLVSHADWSVRAEAIETLASRRMRRAVPAILRRLDTEQDEYVRSVTLRALQRLES